MSIENFLNQNMSIMQQIIDELPQDFSSHRFIQRFARRFEGDYIGFLYQARKPAGERGAFQEGHSQIARFMSKNSATLGIQKTDRTDTQNVFGNETDNQGWKKV